MKRTFKKITATVMAIATLAVGMTGVNANASQQEWGVRHVKSGGVNYDKYEDVFAFISNTVDAAGIYESCTTASYCISANGQTSRARYRGEYQYVSNGTIQRMITFSSMYHTIYTQSNRYITFTNKVPKGCTYYVHYYLEYYTPGSCYYSGTIG